MTYQSDNMTFNNAMDSLSHYGILGMKWGVRNEETLRKYAGPKGRNTQTDNEITSAERARYYTDHQLNRKGQEANRKLAKDYRKYEQQIFDSVRKDPRYNEQIKKLKEAQADSISSRTRDQENWANGKDFKGLDYYQFKDAAADRWSGTSYGKQYHSALEELRKITDKAVDSHKDSSKLLKSIPYTDYAFDNQYKTMEYGKEATHRILNKINYGDLDMEREVRNGESSRSKTKTPGSMDRNKRIAFSVGVAAGTAAGIGAGYAISKALKKKDAIDLGMHKIDISKGITLDKLDGFNFTLDLGKDLDEYGALDPVKKYKILEEILYG